MERRPIQRLHAEREEILNAIGEALRAQPHVVFAYAHGSFLEDRPFHDIDLAVHVTGVEEGEQSWFALELAAELERMVRLPIEVQVLNHAPLGFRYHACRGRLLSGHEDVRRADWVERTMSQYLDLKPIRQRALKEAMTAWT